MSTVVSSETCVSPEYTCLAHSPSVVTEFLKFRSDIVHDRPIVDRLVSQNREQGRKLPIPWNWFENAALLLRRLMRSNWWVTRGTVLQMLLKLCFIYTFLRTTSSFSSFIHCKWKIPAVWIRPSWRQSDKRTRDVYAGQEIVFKKICLFRSLLHFKEQFTELLKEESLVEKMYY